MDLVTVSYDAPLVLLLFHLQIKRSIPYVFAACEGIYVLGGE